jgi:hypothetical protein
MRGDWEVQEFAFDVERVAEAVFNGQTVADKEASEFASQDPVFILFHEGSIPMRIDHSTAALLALVEQERLATCELVTRLQEFFRAESTESLEPGVLSALEGLYWEGAIGFESAS